MSPTTTTGQFAADTSLSLGPPASTIKIVVAGEDVTSKVIFQSASFESQASGVPGQFQFTIKDEDRSYSVVTGAEVQVYIDGVALYGGIVMQVTRAYPFSVEDTTDLTEVARYITLQGADYNIWFDKRVLRNPGAYKKAIRIGKDDVPIYDGKIIREHLPNYIDVPPGVDMTSEVQNVSKFGIHIIPGGPNKGKVRKTGFNFVQQGDTWRNQMEILSLRGGAVWYIDASKKLHFKALETSVCPWAITDWLPDGVKTIGGRDITASEDGAPIANDALVWGGLEVLASKEADPRGDNSGIFFARQKDDDSIAKHGRWQYAEVNFERGDNQESVDQRANIIINGPPGNFGGVALGLNQPQWSVNATWFAHDVPNKAHIRPGQVMNFFLYALGQDRFHPLVQSLPLLSMTMTFPAVRPSFGVQPRTYVQFTGQFGLQYSDPRVLWKFLLGQRKKWLRTIAGPVDNASAATDGSRYNGNGSFYAEEDTDGTRTTFTFVPYVWGTTFLILNGIQQRLNIDYYESSAGDGEITFYTAPLPTDTIFMYCRTSDS